MQLPAEANWSSSVKMVLPRSVLWNIYRLDHIASLCRLVVD